MRGRPRPPSDVEPQRAGGVRHVGRPLAGQAQAHVVLGQQHGAGATEDLGLVLGDPQQLRGGEAGHREIAGDLACGGDACFERGTLRRAAAVVPEDGRPQHRSAASSSTAPCIWPDRPMPRTAASAAGCRWRRVSTAVSVACHHAAGSCSDQRGCGRCTSSGDADLLDRNLAVVDQQRLERRRPEVDAEVHAPAMRARNAARVQDGARLSRPYP